LQTTTNLKKESFQADSSRYLRRFVHPPSLSTPVIRSDMIREVAGQSQGND